MHDPKGVRTVILQFILRVSEDCFCLFGGLSNRVAPLENGLYSRIYARYRLRIMTDQAPIAGHSTVGFFEKTVWSTVLKAKEGEDQSRQAALERLLERYRQPILRHIQASLSGHRRTPEHAEDLTQEFIHQCLRLDFLKQVSPERGRFRAFIKSCITNFLRDQHDRESAQKRGGGVEAASLDETDAEGHRLLDPAAPLGSPDDILDREWALSILDRAIEGLGQECVAARRGDLFEALKGNAA